MLMLVLEVSDGVIAPGYDAQVLEILSKKKDRKYTIIQINPNYEPSEIETRQSLLAIFSTEAEFTVITDLLLPQLLSNIHNLILYVMLKMECIELGAWQRSRIHCMRLAGEKATTERISWKSNFNTIPELLMPKERKLHLASLSGVALSSDAFLLFPDNIHRAHQSGADYVADPSGSIQD
ncbi:phosphoribosylaminoimidazolecarboxamide formyltransferase/IMP cyclohydrolase [Gigaspora margarita]|uniref:Phosphoribosylaminoimidazolecarboxamide formyltransferase/IMP cyclohydrolase n=1 Tax=Gigaspora margarita TaxID=4874 RepID=A0A8H4ANJ0_GIGMA|nr:phosphoribosylaminoimidazolecarboxamide formyltransferase/IMP cyclohydrolase [Gigaspora margarita]